LAKKSILFKTRKLDLIKNGRRIKGEPQKKNATPWGPQASETYKAMQYRILQVEPCVVCKVTGEPGGDHGRKKKWVIREPEKSM